MEVAEYFENCNQTVNLITGLSQKIGKICLVCMYVCTDNTRNVSFKEKICSFSFTSEKWIFVLTIFVTCNEISANLEMWKRF